MAQDGIKTPIEPGLIARLSGGIKAMRDAWFGPMEPLPPLVPTNEKPSVEGRQFDYPVGWNTRTTPRDSEPVSFAQMRALADGYDLLRLVIETRKDQMAKLKWTIKPKDEDADMDERCTQIRDFFATPDQEHSWDDWLRMLLEDLFVIDAPALYVRPTVGGQVYAFEPLDGSTIKRVIDVHGRTPLPPNPAYQQILKGVPAINYTKEELIYRPRNIRTHKIYGYSPVEQIIMTVNIAIRRQVHQLQYYTEGSTPDLIFGVPKEWNPDQIKKFKQWWDEILTGNTANRRGTMFVPEGAKPMDVREKALKDEYDEWLARVICFAFSLSPQAFIKDMNRATAQTAVQQAASEGLYPIMQWVKGLLDFIIAKKFNAPDLEFSWNEEESLDSKTKAEINQIYINAKVLTPDEVRADSLGKEPLTPEERESAWPTPVMGEPGNEGSKGGNGAGGKGSANGGTRSGDSAGKHDHHIDLVKRKKKVSTIDRSRPAIGKAEAAFRKACSKVFPVVAKDVAKQLNSMLNKVDMSEIERILNAIDVSGLVVLADDFEEIYEALVKDGAAVALAQIGVADKDQIEELLALVNKAAVAWASERAAEMVGMRKLPNGELIENPDAQWRIDESTREMLRSTVTQAMEEGWSNDRLASEIQNSYPFSDERAEMIARTETAFADVQGNMIAYRESGLVQQKEWITGAGCCDECAELDGKIVGIHEEFADGVAEPPYHPNCRCDVLPVIEESETS